MADGAGSSPLLTGEGRSGLSSDQARPLRAEAERMKITSIRIANINGIRVFVLILTLFALMLGYASVARAAPGTSTPDSTVTARWSTTWPNFRATAAWM